MRVYIVFFLLFATSLRAQEWKSPDECLAKLLEGNKRYTEDHLIHPCRGLISREATLDIQAPCGVILSCSDSRVPPEIIFDQGIGDLFVVRVAGNVAGPLEINSIEFAVNYLKASLILVMGHENCGAVSSVLKGNIETIPAIAELIQPSVDQSATQDGNRLENSIKNNVRKMMYTLKANPILKKMIQEERVKIVGGYYDLRSGKVTLISE